MRTLIIPVMAVMMLMAGRNWSEAKMMVAVMDFQPKGVSKVVAGGVADMVRADMVDAGVFTVVERSQMSEILKEQGLQMTGCTDQDCAVQVGKLLSANKILVGEVTRLGKAIIITIRIVDVEKGVADYAAKEAAADEDALEPAARKISVKLIERITGKTSAELYREREPKSMSGYYWRSIVPGWGQMYAGRYWEGGIFMGLFAASAAFSVYAIIDFDKKDGEYDDLPYGTTGDAFKDKYDASKKAGIIALSAIGATAFIYVMHWVDVLFIARPDYGKKSAERGYAEPPLMLTILPHYNVFDPEDRGVDVGITLRY